MATAQSYPTRPVRFIIGYPPGGSADLTARLLGQWLSERLGQPFVIESRPGASTNIATEAVVRAPPDGYTLLSVNSSNLINETLYEKLPYDRHWIYRGYKGESIVDVMWGMPNRRAVVDDEWLTRGPEIEVHGDPVA